MADEKKKNVAADTTAESNVSKTNIFKTAWKKVSDFAVRAWKKVSAFFVRVWKKIVKIVKDTVGELKKVVWTPKSEVFNSFKLVIATVVGISLIIAVIDVSSSAIINLIAEAIG